MELSYIHFFYIQKMIYRQIPDSHNMLPLFLHKQAHRRLYLSNTPDILCTQEIYKQSILGKY